MAYDLMHGDLTLGHPSQCSKHHECCQWALPKRYQSLPIPAGAPQAPGPQHRAKGSHAAPPRANPSCRETQQVPAAPKMELVPRPGLGHRAPKSGVSLRRGAPKPRSPRRSPGSDQAGRQGLQPLSSKQAGGLCQARIHPARSANSPEAQDCDDAPQGEQPAATRSAAVAGAQQLPDCLLHYAAISPLGLTKPRSLVVSPRISGRRPSQAPARCHSCRPLDH
mmetsp:Transcript_153618/g.271124  ORF Transcript_153618/g.271124 Transcript_153618/m.271124 type:complete len:222 (+) Transcript_153618:32-697(+)